MTNSHPSSSERSSSFSRLHPAVQRWIWDQNWNELRDIQEHAITALLDGNQDVIIAAATASGKTEAGFLPICSLLAADRQPSIQALYVAPLKALINDQFHRLDSLCEHLELPVTRWHGDISSSVKKKCIRQPAGILLTTPESLEAICIVHGPDISRIFRHLSHIVIDELHAFLGTERGRQLQSLIHRIDCAIGASPKRVGLSATLGDLSLASKYLRYEDPERVKIIISNASAQELRAQIRGYLNRGVLQTTSDSPQEEEFDRTQNDIASHLFQNLRLSNNLVFANSRADVESYAASLAAMCEKAHLPVNFFPHHGNLSKELREDVEALLKAGDKPINVICTSTLELGIDIGAMDSVAQINAPASVSSLRQRMGRSGRRGQSSVLRAYIREEEITSNSSIMDCLRIDLVQTIAILSLMIERWCESPSMHGLHLSTLVQQILSIVAQYGGAGAAFLWRTLCESGPFKNVDKIQFMDLLRGLGEHGLITQTSDGTIVLAFAGERLVNHYSFYSAFSSPEEYRVFHDSKPLGTLPVDSPIAPESYIIFAGRRWRVVSVDTDRKTIDLSPARGGRVPRFAGDGPSVDDHVRDRMVDIYRSSAVPPFLNTTAISLLAEARDAYHRYALDSTAVVRSGKDMYLFHWRGDCIGCTLALMLGMYDLRCMRIGPAICITDTTDEQLSRLLNRIATEAPPDPQQLTASVPEKRIEKFDQYVTPDLLDLGFAAKMLDIDGAYHVVQRITNVHEASPLGELSQKPF